MVSSWHNTYSLYRYKHEILTSLFQPYWSSPISSTLTYNESHMALISRRSRLSAGVYRTLQKKPNETGKIRNEHCSWFLSMTVKIFHLAMQCVNPSLSWRSSKTPISKLILFSVVFIVLVEYHCNSIYHCVTIEYYVFHQFVSFFITWKIILCPLRETSCLKTLK